MCKNYNVGILLFHEVEVLDFAGPFEVFSITRVLQDDGKPFRVHIIAQTKELICARNGLKIKPDFDFTDAPKLDVLIVPGGYGAEEIEIHNATLIAWIVAQSQTVEILASVCTGAFLLAKSGLLSGKEATTHWMDIDKLQEEYPRIKVRRGVKFVDEGAVITAAGVSAGINMSLHIVERLLGKETAQATARRMEYDVVE